MLKATFYPIENLPTSSGATPFLSLYTRKLLREMRSFDGLSIK